MAGVDDVQVRLGAPAAAEVSPGLFGGFVEHFGTGLFRLTIHGLPPDASGSVRWLDGPAPFARNDFAAPDAIGIAEAPCATDVRGVCTVELPPAKVAAVSVGDGPWFTADPA